MALLMKSEDDLWILDSGATQHISPYIEDFTEIDYTRVASLSTANKNANSEVKGIGIIKILVVNDEGEERKFTVKNAWYSPDAPARMMSVFRVSQKGGSVLEDVEKSVITRPNGETYTNSMRGNLYVVKTQILKPKANLVRGTKGAKPNSKQGKDPEHPNPSTPVAPTPQETPTSQQPVAPSIVEALELQQKEEPADSVTATTGNDVDRNTPSESQTEPRQQSDAMEHPTPREAEHSEPRDIKEKSMELWHRKLGHLHKDAMIHMINHRTATGWKVAKSSELKMCTPYIQGKAHRKPQSKQPATRATELGAIVHTDMYGPVRTASHRGYRYAIIFVDDYSRERWIEFCKSKS